MGGSPQAHDAVLDEVLGVQIVYAASGHNHVGTCSNQLHDPVACDVFLALLDLLQFLHILYQHLHPHFELVLAQVEAEARDFAVLDGKGHALCGPHHLEGEAVYHVALPESGRD